MLVALVAVALLSLCGASAAAAAGSTRTGLVRGVVVLGSFLPVDRAAAPSWTPSQAVVKIFRHGQDRPYRTIRTADGLFSVRLPAGAYRLTPEPVGVTTLPIPHSTVIDVTAGKTRQVLCSLT